VPSVLGGIPIDHLSWIESFQSHGVFKRRKTRTLRDSRAYRQRRHGRGVPGARHAPGPAIKSSAERFSERFEREAKVIASLNHPNICHLYDVGPNYLVMELIEGPTLADRINQGALPLEEALPIARQMAPETAPTACGTWPQATTAARNAGL